MKKNKNELPETITFIATLVKDLQTEENEKPEYQLIWKTKPRLPKPLWDYLFNKKIARGFKTEIKCAECGTVLDSKVYWSFQIEKVKVELKLLGYEIVSETEKEIVFQKKHSEISSDDSDLSSLLKMPCDSFAFLPRSQNDLSIKRSFSAMLLSLIEFGVSRCQLF